jgi:hypothetical protein
MTDREMLELAAKAIHAKPDEIAHDGTHWFGRSKWNPLTDDGDALRLAVKLSIRIYPPEPHLKEYNTNKASVNVFGRLWDGIDAGTDPYAATRRAITRAAAALSEPVAEHFGAEGK